MRAMYLAAGCLAIAPMIAHAESDGARSIKLYNEVRSGTIRYDALPQNDKLLVDGVQALIKAKTHCNHDCSDVCNAADELEQTAMALAQCASSGDYSNDCGTKFRRVKSAFNDYESAVSSMNGQCR